MARKEETKPLDRRQRRTRAALRQALLDLVSTEEYDSITVDQIVDRADVVRATFYAHYTDKAHLLGELSDELVTEAARRAAQHEPAKLVTSYSGAPSAEIIGHAGEHPALYHLVISGAGGAAPRRKMVLALRRAVKDMLLGVSNAAKKKPRVSIEVTATAYASALLGVIECWLNGTLKGTPYELATILARGQVEGLRWALGLPPDAMPFVEPPRTKP